MDENTNTLQCFTKNIAVSAVGLERSGQMQQSPSILINSGYLCSVPIERMPSKLRTTAAKTEP